MKQIFLFTILIGTIAFNSLFSTEPSSPTKFIQQDFDVISYKVNVNLVKDFKLSNDITGSCKITFAWLKNTVDRKFFFNVYKLNVDSIFYNNIKTDFNIIDEQTYSPNQIATDKRDTIELVVYYHGILQPEITNKMEGWGGVHFSSDILYALGVGFNNNYVSCTRHWMPCYDHPSDKAKYHAKFTVPTGYVVASNGLMSIAYLNNGTDEYEWNHNFEIATYMMTFAAGKFTIQGSPYQQIPIQIFTDNLDSAASYWTYSKLPKMHRAFSDYFVNYPFDKIGYVNADIGAMEHQTMITMAKSVVKNYYSRKDSICGTVAHELSHQWFGGLVTPYDFRDAWLNESFATFCEPLWIESLKNKAAYILEMNVKLNSYFKAIVRNEGVIPIYDFPREAPSSNYPETIYQKGALVLGMLRYQLGDSLFFGAIKHYLNKHSFANASTEDLIKDFEVFTKKDLSWFFEQWVYRKGWPKINVKLKSFVTIAPSKFVQECEITQVQDKSYGIYKKLPIEIGFQKPNDSKIYYQIVTIDSSYKFDINQEVENCFVNNGPSLRTLLEVGAIDFVVAGSVEEDKSGNMIIGNINLSSGELTYISHSGKYEIMVIDLAGKVCYKSSVIANEGENRLYLPILSWLSGTYTIILSSDNKYVRKKIIIEN